MSGRTVSGYRDGKPVRGFRKTDVQVLRRRRAHEMPEQVLSFRLPASFSLAVVPGPVTGLIGVKLTDGGKVEVSGRNREFVLRQAALLIKREAVGKPAGRIFAEWSRPGEPPQEFEIVWMTGEPAVMIDGYAMRPIFIEGR